MKMLVAAIAPFMLFAAAYAQGQSASAGKGMEAVQSLDGIRSVSPALEKYGQDRLFGEVWNRPDLSLRDRSVVTLAALIARNQTSGMQRHINLALDHGVKPG